METLLKRCNINQSNPPPDKCITPYGERYVWKLPGKTTLTCHLKDKTRIRHKKRWSQCMYMHYLLDYLLKKNQNTKELNRKEDHNTSEERDNGSLILTIDGDMQFHPNSVLRLIDFVVDKPEIGAACGFILPAGTGILESVQKFEYSVQHWFSKTTEEVLGSVLCTPGCFSVLRGKALLESNILKTFASQPIKPEHFLKYDQGEDRWLLTLLLKNGWKASFLPFSYAYTKAPDTIEEFYKQRRRWNNSLMANLLELCGNWRSIVSKNSGISLLFLPYIVFQITFFILAPGSVLLALVGKLGHFLDISRWIALIIHSVPIVLFIIVCFTMRQTHQLRVATCITIVYGLIQIIILICAFIDTVVFEVEDKRFKLATIFIFVVMFIAIILYLPHWHSLVGGIFYFAMIPSLYLYLIIYSICNLNDVSWSTREIETLSDSEIDAETKNDGNNKMCETSGNIAIDVESGNPKSDERNLHNTKHNNNNVIFPEEEEVLFWDTCISTYLMPEHLVAKSYSQMKEIKLKLKSLRICILVFILVANTVLVVGKSLIHEWHTTWFVPKYLFSFDRYHFGEEVDNMETEKDFYHIDVLRGLMSMVLIFIVSIQTVGMIRHWFSSMSYALGKSTKS